jgi:uncharacterized protein (DUF779 family)
MPTLIVTEKAAEMLRRVRGERTGALTITIDTGCCEGTAPHLYESYVLPHGASQIGTAEGIPVYVMAHLAEQWRDVRVTLDLIDEDSSDALSLETEHGKRFVLRHG